MRFSQFQGQQGEYRNNGKRVEIRNRNRIEIYPHSNDTLSYKEEFNNERKIGKGEKGKRMRTEH